AGKVSFITGSASGIGLEIAKQFAQASAEVDSSDMNAEKCQETANSLKERGFDAVSAPCDVTDEDNYKQANELTQKTFGT
ncbi:SDR family NAD(P)-dependent oxidoreductase, partial [Acinetobacter baumannii]|uniref:SDR family NAD(P)-dependent oxidoreductase n=1 Tax=Acinetobacter baumannii TaxID=470 RepID=UPI00105976F8